MDEKIEIRPISSVEIEDVIELRKKNFFLQNNSLMTRMGDSFLKKILIRFIASENHICRCTYLKENHQMDGYIFMSKDILKTVLWMLPVLKDFISNNDFLCRSHIKPFFKMIYIGLHCIFSRSFFHRAFILEICQWSESPAFYSPMSLYTQAIKVLYSGGIKSFKIFYYQHNLKLETFIKKLSLLTGIQVRERKQLRLNPDLKIVELIIPSGIIKIQ